MAGLQPTADKTVWIEEQKPGYVRYVADDGRRWEVHGTCDRRGNCLIGANIKTPSGLVTVRNKTHLRQLRRELGKKRIDSELDVPVAPGFSDCCDLRVVELVTP